MKVFKASGIGSGLSISYKKLDFETNMRVTSPFTIPINDQVSGAIPKKYETLVLTFNFNSLRNRRADRKYHDLSLCSVSGCTAAFESSIELDAHIAANQHHIPRETPRTANDIARLHLNEVLRSTSVQSSRETRTILQQQTNSSNDLSQSAHYKSFSSSGWALRVRKLSNPMGEPVKNFIEQMWLDSLKTSSRITAEKVQEQIRTKRDNNGTKLFQTHEYPTVNQIKYRFRKLNEKHGVSAKQQLIAELIDENIE
jgi:hypothetical protein